MRYLRNTAFFFALVFILLISLPNNPLLSTLGITILQERSIALTKATYYSIRSMLHHDNALAQAPVIVYGTLDGIQTDGRIQFTIPSGDHFEHKSTLLADVIVRSSPGAQSIVDRLKLEDVKFVVYKDAFSVLYVRDDIVNMMIIKEGFGEPVMNPSTNILDAAFAAYYWRIFKGIPS